MKETWNVINSSLGRKSEMTVINELVYEGKDFVQKQKLYLAGKLTDNQETFKLFTILLSTPTLTIVMLYGVTARKHVLTN